MATPGTKYYNLQTKLEQHLVSLMRGEGVNLLQAQLIIRDALSDAVDEIREQHERGELR